MISARHLRHRPLLLRRHALPRTIRLMHLEARHSERNAADSKSPRISLAVHEGGDLLQPRLQPLQILRTHPNHPTPRTINIRNQEKRHRHHQREHHKQPSLRFLRPIPHQVVAKHRNRKHQAPRPHRNPVPPRCLRIPLRVQHIVHPRNRQRPQRVGCALAFAEAAVQSSSCIFAVSERIWSISSQFCEV